ncbi:MAG: hypothetical protein O2897_06190 [bacterium]|nr:hypothetical protein [bacterium]
MTHRFSKFAIFLFVVSLTLLVSNCQNNDKGNPAAAVSGIASCNDLNSPECAQFCSSVSAADCNSNDITGGSICSFKNDNSNNLQFCRNSCETSPASQACGQFCTNAAVAHLTCAGSGNSFPCSWQDDGNSDIQLCQDTCANNPDSIACGAYCVGAVQVNNTCTYSGDSQTCVMNSDANSSQLRPCQKICQNNPAYRGCLGYCKAQKLNTDADTTNCPNLKN